MKAIQVHIMLLTVGLSACAQPLSPADVEVIQAVPAPPPTVFSKDIDANSTAVAANVTAASAYTRAVLARERAQELAVKSTASARATDRSFESESTRVALAATSTALAVRVTLDLGEARAHQTAQAITLQSTVDAQVADARATGAALAATRSAVALQQDRERADAEWQTGVITPAKTVGMVLLAAAFTFGVGYCGLRLFDAAILRVRIIRDASGQVVVFPEPDRAGRQTVILPGRAPGAVLQITPPLLQSSVVTADAVDPETTQRAQVIEGLRAARVGTCGSQRSVPQLLSAAQNIRVIDKLPGTGVADAHAIQALEADWRLSHD